MTTATVIGDCVEEMAAVDAESIDAIVCDPPYEMGFMGKQWDATGVSYQPATWEAALRVLKPGGHLLAFGGTRTYHRLACAVEDAGFEIRDSLMWVYGQGFPKSLNISKAIDKAAGAERSVVGHRPIAYPDSDCWGVPNRNSTGGTKTPTAYDLPGIAEHGTTPVTAPATEAAKQWAGWGTALKPGHEPIVVARKPCSEGTVAGNVQRHGTGAINVDACRIGTTVETWPASRKHPEGSFGQNANSGEPTEATGPVPPGRWPANFVLSHSPWCDAAAGCTPCCPVRLLDTQSGEAGVFAPVRRGHRGKSRGIYGHFAQQGDDGATFRGDSGGASRFFYCAKASRAERNAGLDGLPLIPAKVSAPPQRGKPWIDYEGKAHVPQNRLPRQNPHPTVKPVALMQWLVRLVTPPGGTALDPFMGSGTTGIACVKEGFDFIGIERDSGYMEIARRRIAHEENKMPLFAGRSA